MEDTIGPVIDQSEGLRTNGRAHQRVVECTCNMCTGPSLNYQKSLKDMNGPAIGRIGVLAMYRWARY